MVNKIPGKEIQWTEYRKFKDEQSYPTHIVTSNPERTLYYLYQIMEGGYEKIAKSKNPNDFDNIVFPKEVRKNKKENKKATE